MTITNYKGRLSAEEIQRMVNEAEKFKDEDDKQRERIEAKNSLESYAFNMKSTMEDDKVKDKVDEKECEEVISHCKEVIDWIDQNQAPEKDDYESKQKELEKVCTPIITKLYQAGGMPEGEMPGGMPGGIPGGMPGGMPGGPPPGGVPSGGSSGPTIEEVD